MIGHLVACIPRDSAHAPSTGRPRVFFEQDVGKCCPDNDGVANYRTLDLLGGIPTLQMDGQAKAAAIKSPLVSEHAPRGPCGGAIAKRWVKLNDGTDPDVGNTTVLVRAESPIAVLCSGASCIDLTCAISCSGSRQAGHLSSRRRSTLPSTGKRGLAGDDCPRRVARRELVDRAGLSLSRCNPPEFHVPHPPSIEHDVVW